MASVRQNRFGKLLGSKAFVGPMVGNKGKGDCPHWTKVIENGEKLCILRVFF